MVTVILVITVVFALKQITYMKDKKTEEWFYYTLLAQKALREDNNDQAIAMLKKVIEIRPDDYAALSTLGETYYNQGDYDQAEIYIRKGLENTPENPNLNYIASNYWMLSGIKILRDKDYRAAIEYMKKAVEIMPDYSNAMYMLGKLYMEVGDYEKGVETLKKATEVIPDYIDTYLELGGYYLYKEKDFKRAEEYYKKAKEIDSNDGSPYFCYGNLYFNKKRYKTAEEMYLKAIELEEIPEAYFNLAIIYEYWGQLEKAYEYMAKSIKIDPDNQRAHKILAEIKEKLDSNK